MNKLNLNCPACGKGFRSDEALQMHADSKHGGLENIKHGETIVAATESNTDSDRDSAEENSLQNLFKEVLAIFFGSKSKHSVEREMLRLAGMTLFALLVLGAVGYWGFFSSSPAFMERFGLLLLYLMIGSVAVSATLWHLKCYQKVSCSTAMMVGMTVGMLAGFLTGMIVGATNGMFVGSVTGLVVGVLVGSWAGKCCSMHKGIMGVMEGQMAGFMAGPMGAMTSIMMIADNYLLFIPIALFFIIVILGGLMFLLYAENAGQKLEAVKKIAKNDFLFFLIVNFIVLLALALLMVYGPKSALFSISLT